MDNVVKNEFIFHQQNLQSVQYSNGSYTGTKDAMTVFISKWKYRKIAVVVFCAPQATQNLVISCSCFAEDGKEMNKDV